MNRPVWFSSFWQQRNASERRTLTLAALTLVALLGYQFVWSPVQRAYTQAKDRLAQAEQLASFTAKTKNILMQAGSKSTQAQAVSPMLWVGQSTQAAGIAPQLILQQPVGADQVKLKFAAVPFDSLLRWLAKSKEAGLYVQHASITPKGGSSNRAAGLVDAQITLVKQAATS